MNFFEPIQRVGSRKRLLNISTFRNNTVTFNRYYMFHIKSIFEMPPNTNIVPDASTQLVDL